MARQESIELWLLLLAHLAFPLHTLEDLLVDRDEGYGVIPKERGPLLRVLREENQPDDVRRAWVIKVGQLAVDLDALLLKPPAKLRVRGRSDTSSFDGLEEADFVQLLELL